MTLWIHGRVRLGDEEILFAIARQVIDLIGDASLVHLAVRRFDEPEFVDPGKGAHRADETDVWTFRGLDRANPSVVRRMDVANFETGAIARETAWPEGRETTLVGQLRERVGLIHELRELRAAKEIADDRAERFRVDQLLGRHAIDVDVEQRHALFHETLRPRQADAALVGQQFAHCPDAAATEMIDIIQRAFAAAQVDQIFDRANKILVRNDALTEIDVDPEFLVDLVTTDSTEIVFLRIEKESFQERLCVRDGRRIARAQLPINVFERLFLVVRRIFLERLHDGVVVRNVDDLYVLMAEPHDLANGGGRERLESARDRDLAVEDVGNEHFRREL